MAIDKKEIVSRFLKEGRQLEPEALNFFTKNPDKINVFLERFKETGLDESRSTVTLENVIDAFGRVDSGPVYSSEIEIIKKFPIEGKKQKISVEKYTSFYNKRYDAARDILLERMSKLKVMSINKIQKQREFSLIVMVREKDPIEGTLLVEDPTGSMMVCTREEGVTGLGEFNNNIIEDDVFGVVCTRAEDDIKVKKIVWPDIQLKRKISKSEEPINCLFFSSLDGPPPKDSKSYKKLLDWIENAKFEKFYIFALESGDVDPLLGKISSKSANIFKIIATAPTTLMKNDINKNEKIVILRDSSMISIRDVKIFLFTHELLNYYKKFWPQNDEINVTINLLKRRGDVGIKEPLFFGSPPDIIVVPTLGLTESANYKGTTIISIPQFSNYPIVWTADLKTRGINKVDLS